MAGTMTTLLRFAIYPAILPLLLAQDLAASELIPGSSLTWSPKRRVSCSRVAGARQQRHLAFHA